MNDGHDAAGGSCGGSRGDCGCGGSCGGRSPGPDRPALAEHCGGSCGGKCDDCGDRTRAEAIDWGRLQANSNQGLTDFWRQATIGNTFLRTTGEVLPAPILPLVDHLVPDFRMKRFRQSEGASWFSGTMPHSSLGRDFAQTQDVVPFNDPVPLPVQPVLGSAGTITLQGQTWYDDDGCESVWTPPNIPNGAPVPSSSGRWGGIGAPPGLSGWNFAGCVSVSASCKKCVFREGGCKCIQAPVDPPPRTPPVPPPPPPSPPDEPDYCHVIHVTYLDSGVQTQEWLGDEVLAPLGGWKTSSLGPNSTKGVFDIGKNGLLKGFAGFRLEFHVLFRGKWDLCKWGQDGIGPMRSTTRHPSEAYGVHVTEERFDFDQGSHPPWRPPSRGTTEVAQFGTDIGLFKMYDFPGTTVYDGWLVHFKWKVNGWASGTDGVKMSKVLNIVYPETKIP